MKITQSLALLATRLILAYGFYGPAKMKWESIEDVASWFADLGIPLPTLNAYMSASFEMLGVILLALGLFTRWISIPLMFIMLVAIKTAHWENGFEAGNNGFEIPLYYLIMLFTLLAFGGGKISVDEWIKAKWEKIARYL
ncbi:MAG: DoxX family protein [Bacteroidia bacterium]